MTDYRHETWAASRKFNPQAKAPPELQSRPKRSPKKSGKRQQLLSAMLEELVQYRKITDHLAAEVLRPKKPIPVKQSRTKNKPRTLFVS